MKLSFPQSLLLLLPTILLSCGDGNENNGPDAKNDTALYIGKAIRSASVKS